MAARHNGVVEIGEGRRMPVHEDDEEHWYRFLDTCESIVNDKQWLRDSIIFVKMVGLNES